MVNYIVTPWSSAIGSFEDVSAAMHTYVETVDDTKTILLYQIVPVTGGNYRGAIHHIT